MEKVILLEKGSKSQFIGLAIIFCINGALLLFNKLLYINLIAGLFIIVYGIACLMYASSAFSSTSKYAAKVKVTDEFIEFKTSFWKPLLRLNWQDIKHIEFGKYKVSFQLVKGSEIINYDTTAEQSIQVKQLLRASAEERNLEVSGS